MTIMELNAWILMMNCLIYLVATNTDVDINRCDKIGCFCNYEKSYMPVFPFTVSHALHYFEGCIGM